MFDAIAGHDPQDAPSLTVPTSSAAAQIGTRIDGLRALASIATMH